MQARELRKTTRLMVVVTRHAHDANASYLRGEVAEFRWIHLDGIAPNEMMSNNAKWTIRNIIL
jgi:hypothetical protein